ncbi:MAG: alanine racemase [Syntrophomonas sp.]
MKQSPYDKWLEIDIDAVKGNLEAVQSQLDERVRLVAVLKADAYGHGAANIARFLYQNGVDFFAVTFLSEALELRKAGLRSSIMIFSPLIDEEQVKEAIKSRITLTISSVYESQLIDSVSTRLNQNVTVHLKVDTGLGRFGLRQEECTQICSALKENPNIYIEGIYTHMAEAASKDSTYTEQQFARFMQVNEELIKAGYKIPVRHCANSAVFLKYPHMHLEAVRIGTLLSGQYPAGDFEEVLSLADPYKFKSRVISLRKIKAGSYLGYYRSYRLKQDAQIAVIPVGYNDGLGLEIANKAAGFIDMLKKAAKVILSYFDVARFNLYVKIKGRYYPVRGKIFMQMAIVELPLLLDIEIGEEVEIPVRKILAAKDIKRVFVRNGEAVKIECEEGTTYMVEGE